MSTESLSHRVAAVVIAARTQGFEVTFDSIEAVPQIEFPDARTTERRWLKRFTEYACFLAGWHAERRIEENISAPDDEFRARITAHAKFFKASVRGEAVVIADQILANQWPDIERLACELAGGMTVVE